MEERKRKDQVTECQDPRGAERAANVKRAMEWRSVPALLCAACRGRAGGSKRSPRKTRAGRKNVKRALAAYLKARA